VTKESGFADPVCVDFIFTIMLFTMVEQQDP